MAWDNIVKEIHAFAKKVWRKKPTNCKKYENIVCTRMEKSVYSQFT